jgi:hypothetical protein
MGFNQSCSKGPKGVVAAAQASGKELGLWRQAKELPACKAGQIVRNTQFGIVCPANYLILQTHQR